MVNCEHFAKRLEKILDFYDISAATFAETIDVGRSSISHILSGRNKPSLDFVMKVVQTYPEVELYWLLNGKGNFPPRELLNEKKETAEAPKKEKEIFSVLDEKVPGNSEILKRNIEGIQKGIKKIILLYEDGSFEAFENGK